MDQINLKQKKILVTGGNGFLGRHFIKTLVQHDALIYSIDIAESDPQPNVSSYTLDLKDQTSLNELISIIRPDLIYHLAASINRTRDFTQTNSIIETNLTGTINLLNALEHIPYQKFIFISTSEVYGGKLITSPFKEDDSFIPASPYSLSKYCAEVAVQTFSEIYSKKYTVLRLFNFFGKDMPDNFFMSQLMDKLKNNEDFNMTAGEQKRDFLYLKDVINAMLLAEGNAANQHIFNVCSGIGKPIKDIAFEVKQSLKSSSKINLGALQYQDNEVWEMIGDNSKIKKTLGWQPEYTFSQGLQDCVS
ncbi:NAD(P)-dependent oxidoreductase [Winogradskyella sp.]|nr:NAD(P)-dependent oxidoreductase [Winogradskyella sp.]